MSAHTLTQERLKEVLRYDPGTGVFTWRVTRGKARAGERAGTVSKPNGYIKVRIDGHNHLGSRLAWFYTFGAWPTHELDHENRNRADNSLENLRNATRSQNVQNRDRLSTNASGRLGVYWDANRGTWCAKIKFQRKSRHLGRFAGLLDAVAARIRAERELFTHCEANL